NSVIVMAPPRAEAAAPRQAAATKRRTRRRSSKANARPNQCSIKPATRTASPALQKPLKSEVQRLLSLVRFAATVPTITPTTSAERMRGWNMIKTPTAIPDAGKKTATSDGRESKASPPSAAKKWAPATPPAATSAADHALAAGLEASRSPLLPG